MTGAGRGIGRQHAITLAAAGASVIVNDVGAATDGAGTSRGPAEDVVADIRSRGGQAEANSDDISTWDGAQRVVRQAVESFGDLHVLVNNAGILRDRMLVNMTEDEWDAVIRVHLKGTFSCLRWAGAYWRERAKAGDVNDARIINTTSGSGLFGTPGQGNYGAAKAGIAGLTIIAAMELAPLRRDGERRLADRPDPDDRGPRADCRRRDGAGQGRPPLDLTRRRVAGIRALA